MLSEMHPRLHHLRVSDALRPLLRILQNGGTDVALLDANYVRSEDKIYKKAGAAQ
jgi:hypothetical protein